MSNDTKVIVDDVGNYIEMDKAAKYPSRAMEIEGSETPPAEVLIATRLGNYFLLRKGTGVYGYTPMTHASVESFCLANAYHFDQVAAGNVDEELVLKSLSTGEL